MERLGRIISWLLTLDPVELNVVLCAVNGPADAHLTNVKVLFKVWTLPPCGANVVVEVCLATLAAALEADSCVAEPLALFLLVVLIVILLSFLVRLFFHLLGLRLFHVRDELFQDAWVQRWNFDFV